MKGLIFLLLFTSTWALADRPPSCDRLKSIALFYEKKINQEKAPSCSEESFPNAAQFEGKDEFISKVKCADMLNLDEQSHALENQLAILEGFERLKQDIRRNKEEARTSDTPRALRAAQDFSSALHVASAFDRILRTEGETPLMLELRSAPEADRNTPEKFNNLLRQLCRNRTGNQSTKPACATGFSVDQESFAEISSVFGQTDVTEEVVDQWKDALRIQKNDGSDWSFMEMQNTLTQNVNAPAALAGGRTNTITKAQLDAIRGMPDFQSVPSLPVLARIKEARAGMGTQLAFEEFRFLAGDLKGRQQFETRSKVAAVWSELKDFGNGLSPEDRAKCDGANRDFDQAKLCWESLRRNRTTIAADAQDKGALIDKMDEAIGQSISYVGDIGKFEACLTPEQLTRSFAGDELTNCAELNVLSADKATIQQKLLIINELKAKIGNHLEREMRFRNFAVQKLSELNCASENVYSGISCDEAVAAIIPPSLQGLILDVQGVTLMSRSGENAEIEEMCDGDGLSHDETELCKFFDSAPATPNVTDRPAPSSFSPYVEAPNQRNTQREAVLDGITGIGMGIVQQLYGPRQNTYNPYASINPFPYNYSRMYATPGLTSTDQILFNSRFYGGYGFYFPTLGAAPYTAFPVTSPYVQAGLGNSSPYFTSYGAYK